MPDEAKSSMKIQVMGTGEEPIAVLFSEMRKFGCPYCGYRSGTTPVSGGGSAVWECGECGKSCCVLAEGMTRSSIGFGDCHPELQPHPRRGTPAHGRPDTQPEGEGEFFRSRGIGVEWRLTCFCCGVRDKEKRPEDGSQPGNGLLHNIAAFVQCKTAGERVEAMFGEQGGVRMDYRESEPDRVQVKVGSCDEHLPNLRELDRLVSESDGVITEKMIAKAREA